MLLYRLEMRKWLYFVEGQLIEAISYLRGEVKFIEHLPRCRICRVLLKLDVERYLGNHSTWYLCLENNEYLEEQYPDCPKERDYHIGSYWEQLKHYEKYGNVNVPGENTEEFILDRAKWAYTIMGKQIHTARQMLRLIKTWNFSEQNTMEFNTLYEELGMYEVAYSPTFSIGVK